MTDHARARRIPCRITARLKRTFADRTAHAAERFVTIRAKRKRQRKWAKLLMNAVNREMADPKNREKFERALIERLMSGDDALKVVWKE